MKSEARRKRLQRRIKSWEETMSTHSKEPKVQTRKSTGGYRMPGSLKK